MPPRRRVAPQSSSSGESSSDDAADAPKRGGSQADSENSNELCSLKRCQGPKGCICPDKRKSPSKFAILPNISPGKSNAATGRGAKARMKVKASGGGSSSDSSSSEEDDAPRKKAIPRKKSNPVPAKKRAPPPKRNKPPPKKRIASGDAADSEESSSSSDDDAPRKKAVPRRSKGNPPPKKAAKAPSPEMSKEQTPASSATGSSKPESAKEDEHYVLQTDPSDVRMDLVNALPEVITNRTKSAGKAHGGMGAAQKKRQLTKRQEKIIKEAFLTCDVDESDTVDKAELKEIMNTIGLQPNSDHEMNGLFQLTDTDGDQRCTVDEVLAMMAPRVGVRGDPGIVLDMGHLAVGKGINKKDIKQPQLHIQLGTKMRPVMTRAKPASKDKKKKETAKPKHKLSKISVVYEFTYKHFFETPLPCTEDLYIEVVNGGPKNFGMDGRLEKTTLAVAIISLADVEDEPTTKHVTLYKPVPKRPEEHEDGAIPASARSGRHPAAEEDPRAVPSEDVFGVLDITLDMDIQEAEEDLGLPHDADDQLVTEAQLDVHAVLYDEAEKDIRKLIGKQSENQHHQEMIRNKAVDAIWKTLDPNSIGVASLGRVDFLVSEKFSVLSNTITLYYAYQFMQSGGHATIGASSLSSKPASRRSWVTYQDFLPLICNAFYFKRFWEVYERYLMNASGKVVAVGPTKPGAKDVQYTADPTCGIDTKEFFFIMRRCGLRLSDQELNGMFESCGATDSGKILLAAACNVVMTKTFFPFRSEVKLNIGKEAEKTYAAKLKKKRDEKAKGIKKNKQRRGSQAKR